MRVKNIITEGRGSPGDSKDTPHFQPIYEEAVVPERWASDSEESVYFYSREQVYGFIKG